MMAGLIIALLFVLDERKYLNKDESILNERRFVANDLNMQKCLLIDRNSK
jgi:hypothetical protein